MTALAIGREQQKRSKRRCNSCGGDPADWLLMAMAYRQQGNREAARSWYEKAVRKMETTTPEDQELVRLRVEAAAV